MLIIILLNSHIFTIICLIIYLYISFLYFYWFIVFVEQGRPVGSDLARFYKMNIIHLILKRYNIGWFMSVDFCGVKKEKGSLNIQDQDIYIYFK